MDIILGATGQIGSMLVDNLIRKGQSVRAVVRNSSKAEGLRSKGVEVSIADCFDVEALKKSLSRGKHSFSINT